ncbi:hypothetical protein DSO57_1014796 [Entomophthora muscae]|uniref:Uncharacterized protein n=1 Tax=Entomophthora muscae TaxID=34485 RepID=A0ACC2URM8_9FUNG|nr:hypothetical protein DSO57_1014796 [Entomophthora muscae]
MGRGFVYRAGMMAAIGGFLFGYDLGVISGVLVTDSFNDFFQPMSSMKQGLIVSMLMLGCFVGSLISGVTTERIGRKFTIMAASLVFIVGAMLQCLASDIVMLYIGRLVGGLGVGHLSMTVPMYLSEISPPEVRGRLVSLQQMSVTLGVAISFWIDYACGQLPEELVWRVPLGIQALPAIVLLVGSLFLPYSPRWLMSKGREELAQKTLVKLRGGDVAEELAGIRESLQQTQSSYANLFRHPHSKRMVRGIGIQFMHQMSGIIAIIYYAPIIFQNSGLDGHRASLAGAGDQWSSARDVYDPGNPVCRSVGTASNADGGGPGHGHLHGSGSPSYGGVPDFRPPAPRRQLPDNHVHLHLCWRFLVHLGTGGMDLPLRDLPPTHPGTGHLHHHRHQPADELPGWAVHADPQGEAGVDHLRFLFGGGSCHVRHCLLLLPRDQGALHRGHGHRVWHQACQHLPHRRKAQGLIQSHQ